MPDDDNGRVRQGDYAKRKKAGIEKGALKLLKKGMSTTEVSRQTGVSAEWLNLKRSRRQF